MERRLDDAERRYWVALSLVPGIGPARFTRLIEQFGSAEAAWRASPADLARADLDRQIRDRLLALRARLDPDEELARLRRRGISTVTSEDASYPESLRTIADPPPILYVLGELAARDAWAVAVVGTRRATAYGRQVCDRLVGDLARAGVTIVSGLAKGIDTYAHRAALAAGGRTVAVLAHGLDQVYPPENLHLAREIAGQGALVTEFALGTRPDAANFPRRNRIIAGLACATLVVEAGASSGALITADFALEQGRDVFAVPGSIFSPASEGTNRLIRDGAKPVCRAEDVLEELNLTLVPQQAAAREDLPADETEAALLRLIGHEPIHIDDLGRAAALPIPVVSGVLTLLELKGMVIQVGAMQYVRARA